MFNTTHRLSWFPLLATAAFLGLMTLLSGCGGGGASSSNALALTVNPVAAVAYNGIPVTFYITGGAKPFYVTSSDTAAISVDRNVPDESFVINANNVSADTPVTLTILDSNGATTPIAVTVKPALVTNTLTVTPDPGTACGTSVCSGMQATVSAQLKNMSAILANRTVRFDVVQGDYQFITNASGTSFADSITTTTDQSGNAVVRLKANTNAPTQYAILKVTDVAGGSFMQTTFTIAQFTDGTGILSVVPATHTITAYYKGDCSSGVKVDYIIHGGTPPYTVQSTSTGIATVSPGTVLTNGAGFTATTHNAFCPGTVSIDIRDATGRVIQATLENKEGTNTVTPPPTVAFFTTAPAAVTVAGGATASFTVGGGTSPYYASSGNTAIATASIAGTTLTITGVASGGPVNITVADSAGATKTIAVTVP